MTLMLAINVKQLSFSHRVIAIISLERLSKFPLPHHKLVSKFNVGFKSLLHQSLSEPEFYGEFCVYKIQKIMSRRDFF